MSCMYTFQELPALSCQVADLRMALWLYMNELDQSYFGKYARKCDDDDDD